MLMGVFLKLKLIPVLFPFLGTPHCDRRRNRRRCLGDFLKGFLVVSNNYLGGPIERCIVPSASSATASLSATIDCLGFPPRL